MTQSEVQADAIVVLGAAVLPGGQPSGSMRRRIEHAVALWRGGWAPRLLLSGGIVREPPAEARLMAELALAAGLPEEVLVLEDRSRNTLENGLRVRDIAVARGWNRLLLVTDGYHMGRARAVFRRLGFDAIPAPAPAPPLSAWLGPQLRELAARPVYWWRLRAVR